jgi:hypothetical protein
VVCGRWGINDRVWGLGDEGLPVAGAPRHYSLNLSWSSRKPTNLEKKLVFFRNDAGMLLKRKDRCGKLAGEAGMCMKTKALSRQKRECC